jgi:thioredoxin-like negative regulator of GroEL
MKPMSRSEVAVELRHLRRLSSAAIDDRSEWLWCLLPQSMPILRLRVRMLLASGLAEDADAIIAKGLLWRPADRWLTLARAERLLARRRPFDAERESLIVLAQCPLDIRALTIAGQAALLCGRHEIAVERLSVATIIAPERSDLRRTLVEALCAAGMHAEAGRIISDWHEAPVGLSTKVLIAEGRWLDAEHLLRGALAGSLSRDDRAEIIACRLDLLERMGMRAELHRFVASLDNEPAHTRLRIAVSLLWLGEFTRAARIAFALRHDSDHRSHAMTLLAAAAGLARRRSLAACAVNRLKRQGSTMDRAWLQLVWRRGLFGRVIADQKDFSRAGRDPSQSVLKPLMDRSLHTLERAIDSVIPDSADPLRLPSLEHHRAICLRWLGRGEPGIALHSARAA